MDSKVVLFDVASKDRLWPVNEESKTLKVGFDAEVVSKEAANNRLVTVLSHCVVRYLYNCPKDRFKVAEDRSDVDWEDWEDETNPEYWGI